MADIDLGTFLRDRRASVTPEQVGLPSGPRRRTPGLRRAELATLSGVSVEYLTRLEQGRDRHPSMQVLAALADALRLSPDERFHLRNLAKAAGGGELLCAGAQEVARDVRPTVRELLDRLDLTPAVLVNRLGELLAWTTGYQRLAGPLGLLDGDPPSLPRFVFTHPGARAAYPDWERVADERVAALKSESARNDAHITALVDELSVTVGAPFTDRLRTISAPPGRTGVERLVHPVAGELRLAYETLDLPGAEGQRLVVHLPADAAASAALDALTRPRPTALHAVPD